MDDKSTSEISETFADWLVLKDKAGEVFRVDRYSTLHIGADAVDRLERMMEHEFDPAKLAMIVAIRACVLKIQELEAALMPAEGTPS